MWHGSLGRTPQVAGGGMSCPWGALAGCSQYIRLPALGGIPSATSRAHCWGHAGARARGGGQYEGRNQAEWEKQSQPGQHQVAAWPAC